MRRALTLMAIVAGTSLAAAAQQAPARSTASAPSYNRDVAPILFKACVECHRPNQIAPMSLLSYNEARPWARAIKAKVQAREMPPWFADPRYGKFNNKRGLTDAQIAALVAWADAGAPQGTGPAPAVPDFGERSAELMSRPPDAIIDMPVEMDIDPVRVMPFFNVWAKVPFTEDKYMEAVENRPGNRAVTHHSNVASSPLPADMTIYCRPC